MNTLVKHPQGFVYVRAVGALIAVVLGCASTVGQRMDPRTAFNCLETAVPAEAYRAETENLLATVDIADAGLRRLAVKNDIASVPVWELPTTFTFEEDGYVEDDDAASLDFDDLLAEMREGVGEENEARGEAGYEAIALIGWAEPPHYDPATHKLYWAKELEFGGDPAHTLNYNCPRARPAGVLVLNAVAAMDQLATVQADMTDALAVVDFNEGHRYTDYQPGTDKLAAYGIGYWGYNAPPERLR